MPQCYFITFLLSLSVLVTIPLFQGRQVLNTRNHDLNIPKISVFKTNDNPCLQVIEGGELL